MATVNELKSQLDQLKAAGKTESTSKQAGKLARQIQELQSGKVSSTGGLTGFDSSMQSAISGAQAAYQPAVQKLESGITGTKQSYNDLINAIRGQQQVAEQQQTATTAAELARRGVSATSGLGAQQITSALAPVQAQYTQQATQTGVQGAESQNALLNQIASMLGQGAQSGISTGVNLAGLAQQQKSLQQQAAQQAIQNAQAQRQFEQVTLPTTKYNINRPYESSKNGESDWG